MTQKNVPRAIDELALFGGKPIFARPKPVAQLYTPDVDDYLALARRVHDRSGSSGSPMVWELERELERFHGVRHCIAVVNACAALVLLMRQFAGDRRGTVVMPSFSYRGLPHLAQWAGQHPRFCDVDEHSHVLDPDRVAEALDGTVTSILAVLNFNSPGDLAGLCRVAEGAGVPLILDSVDAVGTWYGSRRLGGFGNAETFSLHATKLLNGFEGGYIVTDDDRLATTLRERVEFGANVVLSEYHAAMGYLSLRAFDSIVAGNRARFEAYEQACSSLPGLRFVPYAEPDPSRRNYRAAVLNVGPEWPLSRNDTVAILRAEGVLASAYYSPLLHPALEVPSTAPVLAVSEALAERYIELPTGDHVSLEDIAVIGSLLTFIAGNAEALNLRLHVGSES